MKKYVKGFVVMWNRNYSELPKLYKPKELEKTPRILTLHKIFEYLHSSEIIMNKFQKNQLLKKIKNINHYQ